MLTVACSGLPTLSARFYARNAIVVRDVERGKEVLKPWVSSGDSFGTFLSLLKEKYEHSA